MPNDPLDALFEANPVTVTPVTTVTPEPAAAPAQAEPQAAPRDEQGRFKAKDETAQAAAPAAPEAIQPAPQPQAKPSQIDPEQFKGYLDERDKRQTLERELKDLKERLQQRDAPQVPSFMDDPEGYANHLRTEVQRTALNSRFETSEVVARQSLGDEVVQAAMDWGMAQAEKSQAFATEYVQQRHPVDWIVKKYKRDQLLTQIGDKDPKEWARELLAAEQASPQAIQPASPQYVAPQAPLPTASLASARSAGGGNTSVPLGPNAAFDAMFQK